MIEIYRSYLEIKKLDDLNETSRPNKNCKIELVNPSNFQLNKFFYKQIGRKHRWIDRLAWEDKKWIEYVENPRVKTFVLKDNSNLVGYYETIRDKNNDHSEIAYFGILEEYFGRKCGGYLLSEAINKLFKDGMSRVWLHTCSLDHENAIKNYLARGMKIFKSEKINIDIN